MRLTGEPATLPAVMVLGAGHAGLPLAARATTLGHKVWALDTDADRVTIVNSGFSPVATVTSEDALQRSPATIAARATKPSTTCAPLWDTPTSLSCCNGTASTMRPFLWPRGGSSTQPAQQRLGAR
jgi:hypothetical protein